MSARFWNSLVVAALFSSLAAAHEPPDPCSLISAAEIEEIQGEKVKSTKGSAPERSLLAVSQCFYTLPTFSRSVSVELTLKGPSRDESQSPSRQWKTLFHSRTRAKQDDAARPVPGLGDEAFWSGNAYVGALYVLKSDAYLRISIGGAGDEAARIDRSKRLAEKALARLSSLQSERSGS